LKNIIIKYRLFGDIFKFVNTLNLTSINMNVFKGNFLEKNFPNLKFLTLFDNNISELPQNFTNLLKLINLFKKYYIESF